MAQTYAAIGAGNSNITTSATFIPEIWSDEVIASYKTNLIMAPLVRRMNFVGKKGDTIRIPSPVRGTAAVKAANTAIEIMSDTENEVVVAIDKHYHYSKLIEDMAAVQQLASWRKFYTDDGGYALARQVDSLLIAEGRSVNGGNGTATYDTAYSGADGTTAFVDAAGTGVGAITDAAIRRTIQRLDDNDVPASGRYLVIPPVAKNSLLGLARFTEQAFVGEAGSANSIRNGRVGNVYGVEIYVTPQADTTTLEGARIALMFHKDTFVLVEQLKVRAQTQYKQEYLGDLMTFDTIFGVETLRPGTADVPTSAFALAVPA
jgi:N4-gp56 family major capsid protein